MMDKGHIVRAVVNGKALQGVIHSVEEGETPEHYTQAALALEITGAVLFDPSAFTQGGAAR